MKIRIKVLGTDLEKIVLCRNNKAAEMNTILNMLDEMGADKLPVIIEVRDKHGKLLRMHERGEDMVWKFY